MYSNFIKTNSGVDPDGLQVVNMMQVNVGLRALHSTMKDKTVLQNLVDSIDLLMREVGSSNYTFITANAEIYSFNTDTMKLYKEYQDSKGIHKVYKGAHITPTGRAELVINNSSIEVAKLAAIFEEIFSQGIRVEYSYD